MKYFLVKSYNEDNIAIAYRNSCWATSERNSNAFSSAFDKGPVTLIFSVNGSSKFCGYARMVNKPGDSTKVDVFKTPDGNILKWKIFDIQWVFYGDVNFSLTENILNSLNFNKPLKIGRDGQEIDSFAAQQLIDLFNNPNLIIQNVEYVKPIQNGNADENVNNNNYSTVNSLKLAVTSNPALAIFPVDLTYLTYEQYIELYQKSGENENPSVQVAEKD